MSKSYLLIALTGCVLIAGLAVFTAPAQGPGRVAPSPQMGAPTIAMVDIGYIFKKHTGFQARKASLEAEMKRASDRLKQEEAGIRQMIEALKDMPPGTETYKRREEEVARRRADLQIQFQLQNKEFALKEANMYHTVYQEIEEEVDYLARQNGIQAVLSFNGDPVEKDQPNKIVRNVTKQVVWFDQSLDITPEILRRLNLKYQPQTASPTQPGQRSGRGVPNPTYPR